MYELFFTEKFSKEYSDLPKNIRKSADKQLKFLAQNLFHPSLNTKRMGGVNKWEARITKGYRFTFEKTGNAIILRTIGPHDVLRKVS